MINNEETREKLKKALSEILINLIKEDDVAEPSFLVLQEEFILHHLDYVFSKVEGRACSHDKSVTVYNSLKKYFSDNIPIVFNYNQKYTYALPKVILKNGNEIMQFYEALQDLYYGDPIKYMTFMSTVLNKYLTPKY